MRALVSKVRTTTFGSSLPSPTKILLTSPFGFLPGNNSKKKKKKNPILGPDLPDIWELSDSCPSPAVPLITHSPPSPNQDREKIATIIDGRAIADKMRQEIALEVSKMKKELGKIPGLAVVLVGQRKDSRSYVRFKIEACQEVGITSLLAELPEDCPEDEVFKAVMAFNSNASVHGILVQLPLPKHLNEEKILSGISLEKDVDGFHPLNMGNLALSGREPLFISCASQACIELLLRSGVELKGKKVTMIGRSNVVGLPTSLLLQRHHATVTIVHALTEDPEKITREADIVISAAGVPNLVRGDWLKPGAVVIDVGTNPIEDPNEEYGYRLIGDVCFEEASKVASIITPVPGGVGSVTIAMLLSNTLDSAKRIFDLEQT